MNRYELESTDIFGDFPLVEIEGKRCKYIISHPDVCDGEPVINGTRITCAAVAGRVNDGETIDDIAREYHYVSKEKFIEALKYANSRKSSTKSTNPSRF